MIDSGLDPTTLQPNEVLQITRRCNAGHDPLATAPVIAYKATALTSTLDG